MKLATLKDGSRDGQLVVVSRDLHTAHYTTGMASKLQQALDDWNFIAPQLQDLYDTLNHGKPRHAFAFDPALCMAPLPRAPLWLGAMACSSHLARLYPDAPTNSTPMAQAGGDHFTGPCDALRGGNLADEPDFSAEIAVITGDIAAGSRPAQALEGVRLLVLANAWTLRRRAAAERAAGFGWLTARPATAFSPVAVTPDELGDAWQQGRVHLPLRVDVNGRKFGLCDAAAGMSRHFGELLAQGCATRPLHAGTVLSAGPASHSDAALGSSCIAEKRALETLADGSASTPWLQPGDTLRVEMTARNGQSVFGAIMQGVAAG